MIRDAEHWSGIQAYDLSPMATIIARENPEQPYRFLKSIALVKDGRLVCLCHSQIFQGDGVLSIIPSSVSSAT